MVFSPVERLLAFRYLRARRAEGLISVIAGFSLVGIALGVGTLIVVMAVMNGFRVEMLRQMSAVGGQLGIQAGREGLDVTGDLVSRIGAVPGVAAVAPVVEGQIMLVAGDRVRGALLRGMRPDDLRSRDPLAAATTADPATRERHRALCLDDEGADAADWGSLRPFGEGLTLAVGRRMADLLRLKVGDTVQLVTPLPVATPLGVMPRTATARIVAFFCAGMYDYDANFLYAPLSDVQRLLDMQGRATLVEVFVRDGADAVTVRRAVERAAGPGNWVFDWFQANVGFFQAVQAQSNVMFLVLTLIVVVAAFNIVSSLVMLVRTKTADIAILRTMGASRGAVLRVFLLDGLAIGGAGVLLGVALGLAFARNIEAIRQWLQRFFDIVLFDQTLYLLAEMPSRIGAGEVAFIAAMALAFALLASVWPALVAARLDPVEGLRRE
ncbi:MAG: FtsX-like permease family protein [Alphaproteobacteria bacterium]|nr:FtsX-like permease family protein [Alphaproteobacteria bacterium]